MGATCLFALCSRSICCNHCIASLKSNKLSSKIYNPRSSFQLKDSMVLTWMIEAPTNTSSYIVDTSLLELTPSDFIFD